MATNKSAIDPSIPPLKPHYEPPSTAPDPSNPPKEPPHLASLIKTLSLQPHIEGGYFVETDRDAWRIPSPFPKQEENTTTFYTATGAVGADLSNKLSSADKANPSTEVQKSGDVVNKDDGRQGEKGDTRNASTTIHYLLTPSSPLGAFHRNRGRTVHTLHKGRGRYVIVHADEVMGGYDSHHQLKGRARVETFVVGQDVEKGERLQWVVGGGKYKSSFLLPVEGGGEEEEEALLISEVSKKERERMGRDEGGKGEEEGGGRGRRLWTLLTGGQTVVPGFEFEDHDFMRPERLEALVTKEQADEMRWMLRKGPQDSDRML